MHFLHQWPIRTGLQIVCGFFIVGTIHHTFTLISINVLSLD